MAMRLTVRSDSALAPGPIDVEPKSVVLGGYSARSAEERQRHIDELRQIGIEPPERVPAFWPVGANLVTTASEIQVQGDRTSGEVEYALIAHEGRTYVAVASDQTDRAFEVHSIPRSKQLCAKVISSAVIPLDELRGSWDRIVISSDVSADGDTWLPYQRGELGLMLDPGGLAQACFGTDALVDGTILLSGTIPIVDGQTRYLPYFRAALEVPDSGLRLTLAYRVEMLPERADVGEAVA